MAETTPDKLREITKLHCERPRSRFSRFSWSLFGLLLICSWPLGGFSPTELFADQRLANIRRFFGEIVPYPLRPTSGNGGFSWGGLISWMSDILAEKGWQALGVTFCIALSAAVLAAVIGALGSAFSSRSIMTDEPYLPLWSEKTALHLHLLRVLVRAFFIFVRAIPEYIWAFIFLTVFGPGAWAVVLALALHNSGILGKLAAESIENLPRGPLGALRAMGASRAQIMIAGVFPAVLPRFLLYFFVRWETCIRESTVLGLLGVVSLGYWVQDARARNFYDEMFFFVFLGGLLVLLGDVVSHFVRRAVRE